MRDCMLHDIPGPVSFLPALLLPPYIRLLLSLVVISRNDTPATICRANALCRFMIVAVHQVMLVGPNQLVAANRWFDWYMSLASLPLLSILHAVSLVVRTFYLSAWGLDQAVIRLRFRLSVPHMSSRGEGRASSSAPQAAA
ncbi:hypothetical protein N657DRAFT_640540 [Parathielavia appendiculata]|uniref:Uncharacterized protein n=1 Tax=Parathielavia appendiculata TaxID=2587402 RepID=A0AAN6U5J3_9PEZI|nr:hypothetical protein N657DRAFT_640540 [Parathielavia appendiculata]